MSLPNDLCALDMLIRAASNSLALFGRNQVGRSVIDLLSTTLSEDTELRNQLCRL